ncbi:DUF2207 domain-containing protein [Wohlfahrtiimonas larvae]|uniref:DUF2207 domain-containing protein n=1 Tax=Wohlfahrtiimonas larvae TaxID=1157986 RepID=A0ABP9MXE7_9GAMM|nr:DUF2207 domain-containing protein [Wohlfahrtiimonas larvae]
MKIVAQYIFLSVMFLFNITWADQIDHYDSRINILEDGTIDVVETIEITTNHEQIKLGITREIPKSYYFMNKRVETPVNVLTVTRNGQPENFWTENQYGNVEIFTGSVDNVVDNYLDKGKHTFVIHWQSQNHIRSFENYDELYINAIGHNWRLPIIVATVTLKLPKSVSAIQSAAYYGVRGAIDQAQTTQKSPQEIQFTSPKILGNGKGFTVATGFTKGIIPSIEPNWYDVWMAKALDYFPSFVQPLNIILGIMMAVMLLYKRLAAMIYTKILPKSQRAFMVRYAPPNIPFDLACALYSPENHSKFMLAMLVRFQALGLLSFNETTKSIKVRKKLTDQHRALLSPEELQFIVSLQRRGIPVISLEKYNGAFSHGIQLLKTHIQDLADECYKKIAPIFLIIGIIVMAVMLLSFSIYLSAEIYFSLVFIVIPMLILNSIIMNQIPKINEKDQLFGKASLLLKGLPVFMFFFAFGGVPLYFMMTEIANTPLSMMTYLCSYGLVWLSLLVLMVIFIQLSKYRYYVKAHYVDHKQALLEFKHFLVYTKKAEYELITPNLFEEYLPYSILFGVEKKWIKLYQSLYPKNYQISQQQGALHMARSSSSTFSRAMSSPSMGRSSSGFSSSGGGGSSGGGSGSGGGGSSGGGSGGGGGGGR